MEKTKRIITIFLSVIIALSAIYIPIYTFAQSDENLLKNATITANPKYYNGWYEYNRPLSAVTDGQTYVGIGYNAGNMLALPYAIDGTAFVNFKMDSPITINKLKLYLVGSAAAESNAITDYAVDVKLSDESWKRVAEKHTDSYTEWDAKVETLCFEAVETTEITITFKNSKGQTYAAIYEIEGFFDENIAPEDYTPFDSSDEMLPMPTPVNVLAGKTAICSSGYNDWYAVNRPVSKLTDEKYVGSAGEMWAINYTDGYVYFEFTFDKLISINKVVTSFPGSAAGVVDTEANGEEPAIIHQIKDYAIDGMLENGGWVRLAERHIDSNNEAIDYYSDTVLFETQKVVKLRFTFANAYGQEWAAVREVEAYNDSTVTPEQFTEIDCKDFTEYAIVKPEYKNLVLDTEIKANEAYYNGWYPDNRALENLTDGKTFAGIGYNAGKAAVIPYGDDGVAFVSFKLKEKTVLNKLVVYFPGTSFYAEEQVNTYAEKQASAYAIEVKEGTEWKRVAVRILENSDNWDMYSDTAIFNNVETDEIRILFVNSKGQKEVALFEIEAFEDNRLKDTDSNMPELPFPQLPPTEPDIPEEPKESINILKDLIEIKANDAYYNGWYPDNRALANLTDGKTFVGIGYNAGNATAIPYGDDGLAYVTFKLKEKTYLNKLVIYFPGTSADVYKEEQVSAYAVEVKTGDKWERVAVRILKNSENWDAYSDTAIFNSVETDEIRILFVNSKGQKNVTLFEIEAYFDAEINDEDRQFPELPEPQLPSTEPDEPNEEQKELTNVLKDSTEIKANNGYYNGWYPENRALKNLIDGNTFVGVGYNAGNATALPYEVDGQAFVSFKLKEKTTLNKLVIYFPGTSTYPKEQQVKCYIVEVKTGNEWKRVAVRNIENSDNWDAYSDTAEFNKIECEEVKVIFIQSKNQIEASLFEIEAYYDTELADTDKPLEDLPQKPVNILKDTTEIKANNSYYNGWYPENRALENLIDGKTFVGIGYNAGSATALPYEEDGQAFVSFKLKEKSTLNQLVVYFPGTSAYPKEQQVKCYIVEVRNGEEWQRVAVRNIENSDNWDAYSDTAEFNKLECEEVKVIFMQSKGQIEASLFEIEAYLDSTLEDNDKPLEELPQKPENILKKAADIKANDAYYNGWYPIYRPLTKSIDGNTTFKFDASKATMIPYGSNKHAYIQYDFDKVVKANKLIFYSPDAGEENTMTLKNRLTDYAVDIKLKDGTWKRIIEQHIDRVDDWDIYYEEYLFETVEFVSLRFISKSIDEQAYLAISELEVIYDQQTENTNEYMERFIAGASVYKTDKINNPMFGTKREIEMPIRSLLAGIVPTVGLGDNSWYNVERPLVNITDGIQDIFSAANIATIDYHDSIAYYNFEFSSAVKLNTFRFFVPQNSVNDVSQRPVDFAVDVMLKDGTWKRVAEQHIERNQQDDAYCETVTFKVVECLAIRLTSVADETMTCFALSEVEAFYNEYVTDNYTVATKAPNTNREVPLPKIRNIPTAKFY